MEIDVAKIWKSVLDAMKLITSTGNFTALLKQTELVSAVEAGNKMVGEVAVPTALVKQMLEQRFVGQLCVELERITTKPWELKFVATQTSRKTTTNDIKESFSLPLFQDTLTSIDDNRRKHLTKLKPTFTFDNFAVGNSNQMAYAAAQAVARKPGEAYNPLFIYGGVGVGKTHLMQAVGNALWETGEEHLLFCTAEEFTNDLVEGIRSKTTDRVRAKYRRVKLLMIDDVQFIAGRASIQEDFFHTFNSIVGEGGQIIMTSDRPPSEINKLEDRLKSRFAAGMVVDIGPADFELRTAVLLIKSKQRGVELPIELAKIAAEQITGLRELEGFLIRLMSQAENSHTPINEELVRKLLNIGTPQNGHINRIITPSEVMTIVGNYYGVGVQLLKGEKRTKNIVWPRQILMYILRTDLKLSQEEVGRLVGGRDHSTVIHATDKVISRLQDDNQLKNQLADIKRKLLTM